MTRIVVNKLPFETGDSTLDARAVPAKKGHDQSGNADTLLVQQAESARIAATLGVTTHGYVKARAHSILTTDVVVLRRVDACETLLGDPLADPTGSGDLSERNCAQAGFADAVQSPLPDACTGQCLDQATSDDEIDFPAKQKEPHMSMNTISTSNAPNGQTDIKVVKPTFHRRKAVARLLRVLAAGLCTGSSAFAQDTSIQPQNGQWYSVVRVEAVNGCSPDMQADIESEAAADQGAARFVRFSQPIQASDLSTLIDAELTWENTEANTWVGAFAEAETTFLGRVETRIKSVVLVKDTEKIDQSVALQIHLPPLIAQQIGSDQLCQMELNIHHRRLGG
jgi:hypothetical protein